MRRHLAYLKYVLRHKWFVLVAGIKIGAPIWRLLVHDMSKFRPSEWFSYAYTFYESNGKSRYVGSNAFSESWLHHQRRNKHHWQYWVLHKDNGTLLPLRIPNKYVYEMVADWMGAGRAIHGYWDITSWYVKNMDKMTLEYNTKARVDQFIASLNQEKII